MSWTPLTFHAPIKRVSANYERPAPTDLDVRRAEMYPERRLSMENIISSLPAKPVRIALIDLPSHTH